MRPILLLAAVLALAACQQAPVPSAPVEAAISPTDRLKAEGDVLVAAGKYLEAIEKYREAADLDGAAVGPRFGLGTAYSFLEKRPETIAEFRWVLDRADPGSTEYQEARSSGSSTSARSPRPPRWLKRLRASRPAPPIRARPPRRQDPVAGDHAPATADLGQPGPHGRRAGHPRRQAHSRLPPR
jgi:hypothetical protein